MTHAHAEGSRATRSYRPGDWFALFGERVGVLLPPELKARVAGLWELAHDGAGFDEVLDSLIVDGLRELPAFVLLGLDEGPSRILLRGAACAELALRDGGTVVLDGRDASTWVERSLTDVVATMLLVADSWESSHFAMNDGLVRVSRVDQPALVPPWPPAIPSR
ncbi:hypothetical protein [Nocardioides donggukensis]|uniref:Uncharacterized protein n=1 Tax=Nocardioides donggukensis TaxID=2774019 RepID=A0A927K601_9ACTN|nr:hypothetical protein [Nocardioides donggukensis]MBD8868466.1 hypothetical protein [Nocardioides donggukensis]